MRPNELCPCGSGKKFKKCHTGKSLAFLPGHEPPSRKQQLRAHAGRLQPEQIVQLPRAELAQLEVERLKDDALVSTTTRQLALHDWPRAAAAITELARRPTRQVSARILRIELVGAALRARDTKMAAEQIEQFDDENTAAPWRLALALATGEGEAVGPLRAAAANALRDASGVSAVALARAVLAVDRSLGILLARAAVRADNTDEVGALVDEVERARDDLLLPPGDHADEMYELLGGLRGQRAVDAAARARLVGEAEGLRAGLEANAARVAELEREAARRVVDLREAERVVAEAAQRATPPPDAETRRYQVKVKELEALVREKNEQLATTRRALAAMPASVQPPVAAPAGVVLPDSDDDGMDVGGPVAVPRQILITRFGPRAADAFAEVPRHVAAAAARTVGALAAGDAGPWGNVKPAKDMPRHVLMSRIGIHHRLLFRVDDGELAVLDLVSREELMTTLKHLRSG